MIVLVTGMPRSGSTFTFNVVKQLLSRGGTRVLCGSVDLLEDILPTSSLEYDHIIVKQHHGSEFSRLLIKHQSTRTICSYRDPQEAMASWMQVFEASFEASLENFRRSIDFMTFQRPFNSLFVDYDSIEAEPETVIKSIANHLDQALDAAEAAAISTRLDKGTVKARYDALSRDDRNIEDMGFTFYDQDTFFHRRHVRGADAVPSQDFFTSEEQEAIGAQLVLPESWRRCRSGRGGVSAAPRARSASD